MHTGLDVFLRSPKRWLGEGAVGLLTNPTAVTKRMTHAVDSMVGHPDIRLARLFGPEHGIRGEAQDMVSTDALKDRSTGLDVVSLYGKTFASLTPKETDLAGLKTLIFDIQDIGSRYYTYAATLALAMQACGRAGVRVLVLDRPNPINGVQVEGGGLEPGLENFCALYPIPQRHGMTVGELARLYQSAFGVVCDLDVVPCEGWSREVAFDGTDLPWVMPSPNMPTLDTAWVYPGMCLLEGTNISEGRGTTRPFELFGAPFVDGLVLAELLMTLELPGVIYRPCNFQPTFHKWANEICGGMQLHVQDRHTFQAYRTGLAVLWALFRLWPEQSMWRTKAYEFRDDVPAIDLLTGTAGVREAIDAGADFSEVIDAAFTNTDAFNAHRENALIYI